MSQKLTISDYSLLSEKSLIMTVHPRAFVVSDHGFLDPGILRDKREANLQFKYCTREAWISFFDACHPQGFDNCAGQHWELIKDGEQKMNDEDWRKVTRKMPSFEYDAYACPPDIRTQPGLFGMFPISRIAVVHDPVNGKHEQTLDKLEGAQIDVALVEE
jgi:hypothetical protein